MIYVDRSTVPVPEVYLSERTLAEKERMWEEAKQLLFDREGGGIAAKVKGYALAGRLRAATATGSDYTSVIWRAARPALMQLFRGKCAYCETPLDEERGDVELYRPRASARALDGSVDPLHYYWLAYEWGNTLIACAFCNRGKGTRFPIQGTRVRIGEADEAALEAESPMLLNPCLDLPVAHLLAEASGLLSPQTERGHVTVEVLNFNRSELAERRRAAWQETQADVLSALRGEEREQGTFVERLASLLHPGMPFLLARSMAARALLDATAPALLFESDVREILRQAFPPGTPGVPKQGAAAPEESREAVPAPEAAPAPSPQWAGAGPEDAEMAGPEPEAALASPAMLQSEDATSTWSDGVRSPQKNYSIEDEDRQTRIAYFSSAKRIERFTVRNFKAIGEIQMEFPYPSADAESWLMLLGENGCGKSSILQALALTLMGEEHANALGLDARRYVRRDPAVSSGEVIVELSGVGPIRLEFSSESERFRVEPADPKVLLLGYGATRLLPRMVGRQSSTRKAIRVLNLFDPTAPLADTESWLLDRDRVSDEQFHAFEDDVTRLLMLPEDTRMFRENGQIEMDYNGTRKALRDMSDGYQSIVALAGDISIGVNDWWGGLREAEGIVLLDEIEVHLHPTWKISIVERLRQTCPRLSFVVTTHDPLCLKGLRSEEIVVLRKTDEREVEVIRDIPRIEHLRADQLLGSFLFNLPSTRGSGTSMAIARYSQLLGKRSRSAEEERELTALQVQLDSQLSSALTPVQRTVEKAMRAALAPEAIAETEGVTNLEVLRQVRELLSLENLS